MYVRQLFEALQEYIRSGGNQLADVELGYNEFVCDNPEDTGMDCERTSDANTLHVNKKDGIFLIGVDGFNAGHYPNSIDDRLEKIDLGD